MATPDTKTFTSPLALIKVNGVVIGKMRNLNVTETIRRGSVRGIGNLINEELPPLEWNGSFTCQAFTVAFSESLLPGALIRKTGNNVQAFIDNILLDDRGIDVTIFKKTKKQLNTTTGLYESQLVPFATIAACFIDRESFDISEGQISGRNQDFTYLTPILYDLAAL